MGRSLGYGNCSKVLTVMAMPTWEHGLALKQVIAGCGGSRRQTLPVTRRHLYSSFGIMYSRHVLRESAETSVIGLHVLRSLHMVVGGLMLMRALQLLTTGPKHPKQRSQIRVGVGIIRILEKRERYRGSLFLGRFLEALECITSTGRRTTLSDSFNVAR